MPSEISGSASVYEFAASVIVSEAASFSLKPSEDFARACALDSAGMNESQMELRVLGTLSLLQSLHSSANTTHALNMLHMHF